MNEDRDRSEVLKVDEASARYPWEWIALKVTQVSSEGEITHGQVVAHAKQRGKITKALKRLHGEDAEARVYIFLGGTRRVTGDEFRAMIEEAAKREPYVNARW